MEFELGQRVRIVELECTGRVMSIWIGEVGTQFKVRYFWSGEAKEVYFFADELNAEVNCA